MTDLQLSELLKADPDEGLEKCLDKYSAYIYKIALSKLSSVSSKEDIEEAVSDIFLLFWEYGKKHEFDIPSVQAALAVIAKRHCINLYKKQLRQERELSYDEAEQYLGKPEPPDERKAELTAAIKRLGEPDCEIIMRKYFLGQKSREIARDLNMKTNTVDKKISRGLKKLRAILEQEEMP